jgi:F0F1-type ATP synthase membrane subunit b/b'
MLIQLLTEEPGLFIGLGFVIVATLLLPARVRWYVFTAGMAVIVFRAYQIFWARGRIQKLDKEREQLRNELKGLRERHTELENTHQQLAAKLTEIKQQRDELIKQRQALDESAATYDAEKQRLDAELEKKKTEAQQHLEEAQPVIDFLENFANAERLAANVPKNI